MIAKHGHEGAFIRADESEETLCDGFGELLAIALRPDWIGAGCIGRERSLSRVPGFTTGEGIRRR